MNQSLPQDFELLAHFLIPHFECFQLRIVVGRRFPAGHFFQEHPKPQFTSGNIALGTQRNVRALE